jgi:hypothetical protein
VLQELGEFDVELLRFLLQSIGINVELGALCFRIRGLNIEVRKLDIELRPEIIRDLSENRAY